MSKPMVIDQAALKRLGRYLVDKMRYVTTFAYQGPVEAVTVWTD